MEQNLQLVRKKNRQSREQMQRAKPPRGLNLIGHQHPLPHPFHPTLPVKGGGARLQAMLRCRRHLALPLEVQREKCRAILPRHHKKGERKGGGVLMIFHPTNPLFGHGKWCCESVTCRTGYSRTECYRGTKSVSGVSERTREAINFAAFSTSSIWIISFGECI